MRSGRAGTLAEAPRRAAGFAERSGAATATRKVRDVAAMLGRRACVADMRARGAPVAGREADPKKLLGSETGVRRSPRRSLDRREKCSTGSADRDRDWPIRSRNRPPPAALETAVEKSKAKPPYKRRWKSDAGSVPKRSPFEPLKFNFVTRVLTLGRVDVDRGRERSLEKARGAFVPRTTRVHRLSSPHRLGAVLEMVAKNKNKGKGKAAVRASPAPCRAPTRASKNDARFSLNS